MTTFEELQRESAWPPATNGMPPLGDNYPDTLLWQYFIAAESLDGELHSLAVNLARLSDKAVREYRAASEDLTAFLGLPQGVEQLDGHTCLLRATDRIENCIDAIRRAEGFIRTPAFKSVATAENQMMLRELLSGLRKIRNSIQHAEERYADGHVPQGEPILPAMTSDCLYFARAYVPYAEIAALIIILWQLANAGIAAVTASHDTARRELSIESP